MNMPEFYEKYDNGFCVHFSCEVYSRPAVLKALYAFHDRFLISYEITEKTLDVFFEPVKVLDEPIKEIVAAIQKELDFQMIRYDTMKSTNDIRKLLVARSLFTSCIEPEVQAAEETSGIDKEWKKDADSIFATWSEDL